MLDFYFCDQFHREKILVRVIVVDLLPVMENLLVSSHLALVVHDRNMLEFMPKSATLKDGSRESGLQLLQVLLQLKPLQQVALL